MGFSWSEPIKQTLSHDQTTPHGLSGGLTEWLRWIDSCRATSEATPACLTLFGQRPGGAKIRGQFASASTLANSE